MRYINKTIIILFLILLTAVFLELPFSTAESDTEELGLMCSGHQIPVGEAMQETMALVRNAGDQIIDMGFVVDYAIRSSENMVNLANNCTTTNCHPVCTPEQCNPFSCNCRTVGSGEDATVVCDTCHQVCCIIEDCSGSPCNNDAINENYTRVGAAINEFESLQKKYEEFLVNTTSTTEDIEELNNQNFSDYSSYQDFYNYMTNFGLSLNETTLPPIGDNDNLTIMEYIKRKADVARAGLAKCTTPTATDQDIYKIESGEVEFKMPWRCDVLLENYISMPAVPKSPFNYYCCY